MRKIDSGEIGGEKKMRTRIVATNVVAPVNRLNDN